MNSASSLKSSLNLIVVKTCSDSYHIYSDGSNFQSDNYKASNVKAFEYKKEFNSGIGKRTINIFDIDIFLPVKSDKEIGVMLPGSIAKNKKGEYGEYKTILWNNDEKKLSKLEDVWMTIRDKFNFDNLTKIVKPHIFNNTKKIENKKSDKSDEIFDLPLDKIKRVKINKSRKDFILNDVKLWFSEFKDKIHNYGEDLEKEITILTLYKSLNSWIEEFDENKEDDKKLTEEDIFNFIYELKNENICKFTDKAIEYLDSKFDGEYGKNKNTGSENTLLKMMELYNKDAYNKYIKKSIEEYNQFEKIMNILNSPDKYNIVDIHKIIKTFEDTMTVKDIINIDNKYNLNIKEIRSSNKMTNEEIDEFIELSKEEKIVKRIDIADKTKTIDDIIIDDFVINNYINFNKLGKILSELMAMKIAGSMWFYKNRYDDIYFIKECSKTEIKEK